MPCLCVDVVDDEILDTLREQVRAEQAKTAELKRQNDLAEETLKVLNRTRTSEATRVQFWAGISEKTAALVEAMPETALLLHGLAEKLEQFGEMLDQQRREDSKRLARLEYGLMLLLQGKGNGNRGKVDALLKDIEKTRARDLLEENFRQLHELEMKRARYGNLEAPAWLLLQIEDLKQEIDDLQPPTKPAEAGRDDE